MEERTFLEPAVAALLKKEFVEARLHADSGTDYEDVVHRLQDRYAGGNRALPIYVVVDPSTEVALGKLQGAYTDRFLPFLEAALRKRGG